MRVVVEGLAWVVAAFAAVLAAASAIAADPVPAGVTMPVVLLPYDPAAPSCSVPPNRQASLAFVRDNDRAFIMGAGTGLAAAARDRGLAYEDFSANNDAAAQFGKVEALRLERAGAVVVPPVNPGSLAPALERLLADGGYVGSIVPPPATTIVNAPQYLTGKTLGEAAAAYIRDKLGGKASVVLLTQDSLQFLASRFAAIRDVLDDMPGVTVIADISPDPVNEDGGYATMQLVLEAHPNVDVVLGADTVVLGALRALRDAGKARPEQFLGGIDGEPKALAEIADGTGPYKVTVALSSPVFGYALGMAAADWLKGKSVPQAIAALPIALTKDDLAGYAADQADPGAVYADPARRERYVKLYGNTCYDTRAAFLNFPWSPEAK